MAVDKSLLLTTVPAQGDLSANQYLVHKINTSGNLALATGGDYGVGILQNKPSATGRPGLLGFYGVSKAIAGGTVTRGDRLMVNSASKLVTGTAQTPHIAIALESAALNEVFSVLLTGPEPVSQKWTLTIPLQLAGITGNVDVITNYTPGYAGKIVSVDFAVTTVVTTGSKAATLNLEIGTTNLTGGAVALTSANCTPLGALVAGSAVTAANVFTATDTISLEAASVTQFSEGAGVLLVGMA